MWGLNGKWCLRKTLVLLPAGLTAPSPVPFVPIGFLSQLCPLGESITHITLAGESSKPPCAGLESQVTAGDVWETGEFGAQIMDNFLE